MRIVAFGDGAIGVTIVAAVALSGKEVVGIARGTQLNAVQGQGLLQRTPMRTARTQLP